MCSVGEVMIFMYVFLGRVVILNKSQIKHQPFTSINVAVADMHRFDLFDKVIALKMLCSRTLSARWQPVG